MAVSASSSVASRTVTFVFTDIEGSTELARQLGDRWSTTLGLHRDLLRAAFSTHAGQEIGTEGDSFFVVFPSASAAVSAAADAQRALAAARWPEGTTVRVRMGIHTGEARVEGSGYVGLEVHRAARIAAAGHGGQVLLSATTVAILGAQPPAGLAVRELGAHRLKDFDDPIRIYQLVGDGLDVEFPPLRSLGSRRADVPRQLTSFVGRESDVATVEGLVGESRLLTLTGPGGTGKTRLAIRVASDLVERFDDGASFVPLAPVSDPALVLGAIAQVLGIQDAGDRPLADTVDDWLRDRNLLLVLDNFEHVLTASALVARLLASAGRLHVLATSREVLHLAGEREYPVDPLEVPDPAAEVRTERLLEIDAVLLFVERARAVRPEFRLTDDNARTVVEICRRLDGLPLAIELAAARLRILSPEALLDRLGRSLDLLSSGARDVSSRQQTLRGAIEWSERLLEPSEATLFRGLAVFRGGWTIDAAQAVAGASVPLGVDVFDGVAALADKSLVRPLVTSVHEPRFLMLETIREFALERLVAEDEIDAVTRAHSIYFSGLAAQGREGVEGVDARRWLERLEIEIGNLRAALEWLLEHEPAAASDMGADLWRFWQRRGFLGEGRRWLERIAELPAEAVPVAARANALGALGSVAYWQNDFSRTRAAYEASLAAWRETGDEVGLQVALYNLGFIQLVEHHLEAARAAYGESLEIAQRLDQRQAVGRLEYGLGMVALVEGRLDEARRRYEEAIRILDPLGDEFGVWSARRNIVEALSRSGELDSAAHLNREVAAHAHDVGDPTMSAMALDDFASIESIRGDHRRAVLLAAAAAAMKERAGGEAPLPLVTIEDVRAGAAGHLSPEEIERLWAEGRTLDDDAAYALAIGAPESAPGAPGPA
jgi:predicted ATPase/class 3 adenylate cyclase